MDEAKRLLQKALHEWIAIGEIPEAEWGGRVRSLEFQETLRTRNELITSLPNFECKLCVDFEEHVSVLDPSALSQPVQSIYSIDTFMERRC